MLMHALYKHACVQRRWHCRRQLWGTCPPPLDIEEFNFQFTLSSTKFDGCRSSIVYSGPAVMSPR